LSNTANLVVDPESVSIAAAIRAAATAPCLVLTGRALRDLGRELGTVDVAWRWLAELAAENGRPIGVNLPGDDGKSQTVFLAPNGWSQERLRGWVAGHHAELEAGFGEVAGVRNMDAQRHEP
jgi:hypothetical protein